MRTSSNVLVIDDDAVVGRSFDRVLSEKGYAVSTAQSGQEALNKLDGTDYDVVFTDIKMPGMDGLEVTKRIKERCPWTPVVIITGYGTADNEAKAKVLGVSGFVHKPLTPAMIENITLKAMHDKGAIAVPADAVEMTAAPELELVAEESRLRSVGAFARSIALLLLAPFIGLIYALSMPFIGLGMLVWMGGRALARKAEPK